MTEENIYKTIKLFIWLLGKLPMGVAQFFSDSIGILWFHADARHRNITLKNLEQAYGKELSSDQILNLGKRVFKNIASILFEVAWSIHLDKKELMKHFTIKGVDNVKKAHEKGRGIIAVTCHMGNFELLIAGFGAAGFNKGYGVYRKLDFKPMERLILEIRQRFGVQMIPLKGASRKIDSILKNGGVMGTLLDQNVDYYQGPFVNFFGKPACTNDGLASMALRTEAPVVPMYTARKNRKFIIEFLPELKLQKTSDRIKDIENNTQSFTSAIEFMVRKYPDQYFWVHNRWKTKPYCVYPKQDATGC